MNGRLAELTRRRESLIAQLAAQRDQLAQAHLQIKGPVQLIKAAITGVQTLKASSTAAMSLAALFFGSRRWKYRKWPLWLFLTWLILRSLRGLRPKRRLNRAVLRPPDR